MTDERKDEFLRGQEIVMNEVFAAIAEVEEKCSDTSYGRAKRRALEEVMRILCGEKP